VGSLYEVDDGYAGAGEAMLEMIQKSGVLQEGSQKMVKDWADKYKVIQKTYLDMVEDHFKKLEDIIELKCSRMNRPSLVLVHAPGVGTIMEGGVSDVCTEKNPCTDGFHQ
jgi:hypothetical protein